ncbi:hypothetical protein [Staphylococcus phage VB-SauS-SA2]|nr:hypothetical protein [Staphylococcus phage VB-SauS-SA2]
MAKQYSNIRNKLNNATKTQRNIYHATNFKRNARRTPQSAQIKL